jgi:3-isopropylmalate/(R)-2-methylmalate dehydratase small subunit
MNPFTVVTSSMVPILAPNIDTDQITPMRRMTGDQQHPLHHYAFEARRYTGGNGDTGDPDPTFALNDPRFTGAQIMLTGPNFGCGSSRETAPLAIAGLGFRVLIGTSFADIFHANCYQQGLLPITVEGAVLERLVALDDAEVEVDLEQQTLTHAPTGFVHRFDIDELRKVCLLEGQDLVALTLQRAVRIAEFEEEHRRAHPWIEPAVPA